MEYREPKALTRESAEKDLQAEDPAKICDALVGVAFHEADWRWVQSKCIELLSHRSTEVRGLAATCFGHLARIHGELDLNVVMPILERLRDDSDIGGRVQDALDDIQIYIKS